MVFSFTFLFACNSKNERLEDIKTLWKEYPQRIRSLIGALDLEYTGLEEVKTHLTRGDTLQACLALVEHYQEVDRSWMPEALDPMTYEEALPVARVFMADSVIIHDVVAKIPSEPGGGWKWDYTGPNKDDEFGYSLNAMSYMSDFLVVWNKDQNERLIKVYDDIMHDWVVQHPLPAQGDSIYLVLNKIGGLDYRDIGAIEWRTLDTGRRLGAAWSQTFYAFQQQQSFKASTRLLMLSSYADQADFLMKYHKSGHNWTTMEMNGLGLTGLAFPEFKRANEWANYALETMTKEINRQVYPDGVQVEISTKTQWVALRRFESLAKNFNSAGREISAAYQKRIEEMYNYLAYCMRPDGHQPINNDSDREDLRERILIASKKYHRPDWEFVATNGKEGVLPGQDPSVTFPWAGIEVMRSGWDEKADWTFFDHGPYGTGHQHRDMLHISIAAFGQDLLVDGGRYTHRDYFSFDPTVWRGYFRGSWSHNVILVDNQSQKAGQLMNEEPLEEGKDYIHTAGFDFATGSFNNGFENVTGDVLHQRSVVYMKNHQWIVVDHMESDRKADIAVLWHFSPVCKVSIGHGISSTQNPGSSNLKIIPLGNMEWKTKLVSGQEEPTIQGWYSEDYDVKAPNPTAIYQAELKGSADFAWLMVASDAIIPEMEAKQVINDRFMKINYTYEGKITQIRFPLSHDGKLVKVVR